MVKKQFKFKLKFRCKYTLTRQSMITPFTIQFAGGGAVYLSTLGLAKPVIHIASQKESVLTFTAEGMAMDANAAANEGSVVRVLKNGTPFFAGRLFRVKRSGSGSAEGIEYEVRDEWYDLQRCVYQQQWTALESRDTHGVPTTATEYIGELILGMDLDGNQQNNGQVITSVIEWAMACGAYMQVGTIGVAAPIPFDQVIDLPCSEVIRRMLRWSPDAVAWLDYTQTPPAFNVTRRAACEVVNLPFAGVPEKQDIQALPELLPPCVCINYLQTNTSNDGPSELQITADVWPEGSNVQQLGALVMSCRLAGSKSTYQRQPVTVAPIPTDNSAGGEDWPGGPANDPTILWWQRKVPWLTNLGSPGTYDATDVGNQLVITNVYGVYQVGQGDDDGSGTVQVDSGSYPNELISGTVADWMDVIWAKTTWAALVSYSYPSSTDDYSAQDWDAVNVFGPDIGSGSSATCLITAVATATNAASTTYTQLTGYTAPEPMPEGLAQYLYTSLTPLQYEGSYSTISQEVPLAALGIVLNLAGGRAEWSTMKALVQEIEQELETGRTTYRFGSYGHLTMQDLMELIRSTRTRGLATHFAERQTGQSADGGTPIDGAGQTPSDGGTTAPIAPAAAPAFPFQVTSASDGSNLCVYVSDYSYLFNSPDLGDTADIIGVALNTDVSIGDYLWLEIDQNADLTLNGDPSIQSGSWPGGGGTDTTQYTLSDSGVPYVSAWYVPIAKIVDQSDPTPGTNFQSADGSQTGKIVQLLNTNLLLTQWCIQGVTANVAIPWTGTA